METNKQQEAQEVHILSASGLLKSDAVVVLDITKTLCKKSLKKNTTFSDLIKDITCEKCLKEYNLKRTPVLVDFSHYRFIKSFGDISSGW